MITLLSKLMELPLCEECKALVYETLAAHERGKWGAINVDDGKKKEGGRNG